MVYPYFEHSSEGIAVSGKGNAPAGRTRIEREERA